MSNYLLSLNFKDYLQVFPTGTNCAPLIANLFCFLMREPSSCLSLSLSLSLSGNNQTDVNEAYFNPTSRYLND